MESLTNMLYKMMDVIGGYAPILEYELFQHAIWKYLAYILWVSLTTYIFVKTKKLFEKRILSWLHSRRHSLGARFIAKLIMPARAAIMISILFAGLNFFKLGAEGSFWQAKLYTLSLGICIGLFLIRLSEVVLWRWKRNYRIIHEQELNAQVYMLVNKGVRLFITISVSLMTLHNMGLNITSLIASLSIGSLAVALAAQDTLSNLFGAVSILFDNTFKIGDLIRIDTVEGMVESIGLRSTLIRNTDGLLVTIPNRNMGSAIIVNISQRSIWRTKQELDLAYTTTGEELKMACFLLEKIYRSNPSTQNVFITFKDLGEKTCKILIVLITSPLTYADYTQTITQFNIEIRRQFEEKGIKFAAQIPRIYISGS